MSHREDAMISLKTAVIVPLALLPTCSLCYADTYAKRCERIELAMTIPEAASIMREPLHPGINSFADLSEPSSPTLAAGNCQILVRRNQVWSIFNLINVSSETSDDEYAKAAIDKNDFYDLNPEINNENNVRAIEWGSSEKVHRRYVISHISGRTQITDYKELPTRIIITPMRRRGVTDLLVESAPLP